MKIALSIVAALAMGAPAVTLTGDQALVITGQDIQGQLRQMETESHPSGMSSHYLANYKSLTVMLSLRSSTGQAEVHQHVDDVMVVQQGTAKLTTGGTLIDGKPVDNSGNGEIRGTGIEGGTSRMIEVGDVVIVPAGVPHFVQIPPGTVYSALVTKVKEP
jgi:mannose-6-phosphate isomerase-like protein (cupin superfamily)